MLSKTDWQYFIRLPDSQIWLDLYFAQKAGSFVLGPYFHSYKKWMEGLTSTQWLIKQLIDGHHLYLQDTEGLKKIRKYAVEMVRGKSKGAISRDPTLYAADLCLHTLGVLESRGGINEQTAVQKIIAKIAEGIEMVTSVLEVEEPGA